jgi:hypothetical protein
MEETAAAASGIVTTLRARLGRWIGVDAFDALFERALARAVAAHPELAEVQWRLCEEEPLGRVTESPGVTPDLLRELVAATLDELTHHLGRFVGEELAARLVLEDWEQPRPAKDRQRKP